MTKTEAKKRLPYAQVAMYVMVGGGLIGRSYAEQPEGAYIDARVSRRPYTHKKIEDARKALVELAKVAGYNPDNLPPLCEFGNMGGTF